MRRAGEHLAGGPELLGAGRLEPGGPERAVVLVHERRGAQRIARELAPRPRVVRRADREHLELDEGADPASGKARRTEGDDDIGVRVRPPAGGTGLRAQREAGEAREETGQARHQPLQRERRRHGDRERTDEGVVHQAQAGRADPVERRADRVEHEPPLGRERELPAAPLEQRPAERVLERAHLMADGARGDRELFGGGAHAAAPPDDLERAQRLPRQMPVPDLHRSRPYREARNIVASRRRTREPELMRRPRPFRFSVRGGATRIARRDPANGGSTQTTDPEPPR